MFNFTLYKRGLRESWKTIVIFAAVLTLYITVIVSMFNPEMGSALLVFAETMPEIMAAVGMNTLETTLIGFMSSYLYGFVMIVFPMVFAIMTANRLIARHVDSGSMTYLIAAPVKRVTVAFTQMKMLVSGVFAIVLFATVIGIVSAEALFPGALDIPNFILINIGVFVLHLLISGICFLCSCAVDDAKKSIALGAGIPALMFIIQMMANVGEKLDVAKYFTVFSLFNPSQIFKHDAFALWSIAIMLVGAVVLYIIAIAVFTKKDMHI